MVVINSFKKQYYLISLLVIYIHYLLTVSYTHLTLPTKRIV